MLQLEDGEINEYQLRMINQWSIDDVSSFKPIYQKKYSENSKEANECLNTIYEYRLSFEQSKVLNLSNIHEKGIKKFFSDSKKNRTIEELIPEHNEIVTEMKLENYNNSKDQEIINRINNIKKTYEKYINKEITKENISDDLKSNEDELIAIVMGNLKKVSNRTLRDSQLYSLILLLDKNKIKGRIIQVFSGEGKTLIIHCLAAILVFQGHKVDILCAEKNIAKKDAKIAEEILKSLKITVGNNLKRENDCYKKDILYGTIVEFQGGIMRDSHQLNGERQNREFDVVLLDEIECMFLDDFSQSTNLVSNKPFYERYSIYLLMLWGYYKNLHLNNFDVRDNNELQEKVKQYLNEKLTNFIKINDDKSDFFFPMSKLLKDFAISESQNWVDSLIKSLSQRKNIEYAVKNGQILKVDLLDTGLIQKDKPYDNGLQQFLEIQNEISVTPISTKTTQNTLSNYGFFQKYINKNKNSIYGVTGAFGSVKSRELIEKLYDLDFDYIPTNNLFLLKELTSNISKNHDTWIKNILLIVKREINYGRIVLLLCETVGACEEIYDKISLNFPNYKLFKIIGEEGEKNALPQTIGKNTIILSTDMSGRGSKFDIDKEVLKNGGMHIIFSFISNNSRKEEKNYKNAGKAGEPGSYQFILDFEDTMNKYYISYNIERHFENYKNLLNKKEKTAEDYKNLNEYSIENIKKKREDRVEERCNNAFSKIENTRKSDYLFNLYCDMVNERKELKDNERKYDLDSIDEQWGIFLKTMDVEKETLNNIKSKCQNFKNKIFGELNKEKVIKNPGFYNQYVNEQLGSVYFYLRNKNIIAEISSINFQEAKKYFIKNPDKEFEYDKYIQKCKSAIELDNYSFIPYYLNGICKLICGKEKGIDDLEEALTHINNEIQRYLYYFGLLISLNINIDLLFYQINILNAIKINVIQRDIDYYYSNSETEPKFRLYRKLSKDCFLYNVGDLDENEDEEENINEDKYKKILKSIKQFYLNTETNGLRYFFFLGEANSFSLESFITSGIIMIGLSISGISFLENIIDEEIFSDIGNMIGIKLNYKEYEAWIKKQHEKDFPFSKDKNLMDFIKNNNIKIKDTNKDLLEIMKKYDKNYLPKINKEFGKTFKDLLRKKIIKLNLLDYKDFFNYFEQDNNEIYIKIALNNIKDLDEKKKKIILANNFMRRDGRDWLTDDTRAGKDINEKIKNAKEELNPIADDIILRELKVSLDKEILEQRAKRDEKNKELTNQKVILDTSLQNFNSLNESYKLKQDSYNQKVRKNNEGFKRLNKIIDEYNQDNSKHDKQQIENDRYNLNKESDEIKKELEELNNDFDKLDKEEKITEQERLKYNSIIEESNKFNDAANERVELYNTLEKYIKVNFSNEKLKLTFNNINNLELKNFESDLKQIEIDANLAYEDELSKIGKKLTIKEKEKIILEKRIEFEQVLLKVIKEKNDFWNNCFNQAFSTVNNTFNIEDMKKIINNHIDENIKKGKNKNEYYYVKNMNSKKSVTKAEEKLNKEKKIIIGNVLNDNNIWDSYCIIPVKNSKYFLYKSNDGNQPSKEVINIVKEMSGGYVPKINISNSQKETDFSEVNAIENNKIMIDQIEEDKTKFVDNFEKFSKFYNETREDKIIKKQKSYPEEYIRGLYNEIRKRNNTKRISVVLFDKYFLNEDKDNEIDLEFFKKLINILLNYNDINDDEKEIVKKEYNAIIDVYNNVYHLIKQKEEEEEKEIEQIVKNKYKRSIKNVKNISSDKPNLNEINPNNSEIKPGELEKKHNKKEIKSKEIKPDNDESLPNKNEIEANQDEKISNKNEIKPDNDENGANKNKIKSNKSNKNKKNSNKDEIKSSNYDKSSNNNEIKPKINKIKPNQKENKNMIEKEKNEEKKSSNKNSKDNKENINIYKKQKLNINDFSNDEKLKSRNKNNNSENEIKIYEDHNSKEKMKNRFIDENSNSKRGFINNKNKNQNNETIYSRKIKQVVQGSEEKESYDESKKGKKGKGDDEKGCCEKIGCMLF